MPTAKEKAATLYRDLAHKYVTAAIWHGDMPALSDGKTQCIDCAAPAMEYDHRDYLFPLQVEPVCMACNQKRGPGNNRGPSAEKPPSIRKRFDQHDRRKSFPAKQGKLITAKKQSRKAVTLWKASEAKPS